MKAIKVAKVTAGLTPARLDRRSGGWLLVILVSTAALSAIMLFGDLSREAAGASTVILLLLFMVMGIHIGYAMIIASIIGIFALGGTSQMVGSSLARLAYDPTVSWQLSVIPTFILMGSALWKSGMTERAFAAARLWFGRVPGGLGVTTTVAGASLAAASGSTIALTHALGRVAIPEMLRSGYKPGFAIGATAMAGTLGQIIPPSVMLVVYAGVAHTSVGKQLMAGVIPGIVLALLFAVFIMIRAKINPKIAPKEAGQAVSLGQKIRGTVQVTPLVIVLAIVIGGIGTGIFTATEAGVWGAVVAIVVGFFTRTEERRTFGSFFVFCRDVFSVTLLSTAGIFLLLIGVELLTRVVTLSRMANALTDLVLAIGLGKIAFLLILVVLYLVLGMFMDTMAIILLTVPILALPLTELDVDLVWFGVFLIVMVEIAMVTPPMGILIFILYRIVQDKDVNAGKRISLQTVFAGALPFVAVALLFAVLLIFFPQLAQWLPAMLSNTA